MNKYEAMFLIKPDLSETDKKSLLSQIGEAITKNKGSVSQANTWAERRKLTFPINKHHEALYYLLDFSAPSEAIKDIRRAYKLNENILRVLITRLLK